MSSSSEESSEDELFPLEDVNFEPIFQYNDPLLVTGILRAVVDENLERVKQLVDEGKSVNLNDNVGNTALHIAVLKNCLDILKYLLTEADDCTVNGRNFLGQTPLFLAVKCGFLESTKCLIHRGGNVNLPNYEDIRPLHVSVQHPDIAHLLIMSGAVLDVEDYNQDMPLHDAVSEGCLETVCMFLYYNADSNRLGGSNMNPFMKALIQEDFEMQEALFAYIDDFNLCACDGMSTLSMALLHKSTLVEKIIDKGAIVDISAYNACLLVPNTTNFKLVWKRLDPEDVTNLRLLDLYFPLELTFRRDYINVIIEHSQSSVLEVIAANTPSSDLATIILTQSLNVDTILKLTCLLLLHGFELDTFVIHETLMNYGYCELFKILFFMDYESNWKPYMITPRLIFDIKSDINSMCNELICVDDRWTNVRKLRTDARHAFNYWVSQKLFDMCLNEFEDQEYDDFLNDGFMNLLEMIPQFPSLLELSRNATRKFIISNFNVSTTCQYYTIVNHLNISPIYRRILTFERKLYHSHQIENELSSAPSEQ